jgi:hypothetical protein
LCWQWVALELWRSQLVVCSLGQCLNHWNPSSSSQAMENGLPIRVLKRLSLRSQSSRSSVRSPIGQPIASAITSDRETSASMNRRPLAPDRWYSGRNQSIRPAEPSVRKWGGCLLAKVQRRSAGLRCRRTAAFQVKKRLGSGMIEQSRSSRQRRTRR